MGSFSQSNFGPLGDRFERLRIARAAAANAAWNRAPESRAASWNSAKAEFYDPTGFWFDAVSKLLGLALAIRSNPLALKQAIGRLWPQLSEAFRPKLRSWPSLTSDARFVCGCEAVSNCYFHAVRTPEAIETIRISWASLSNDEILYLAQNHPRIFDAGAGSGYLSMVLDAAGIDVIGTDDGRYDSFYDQSQSWFADSRRRGLVIQDDCRNRLDLIGPDRALGIFWPEPGSSYPADMLEAHRKAGGTAFLFKLGVFIGQMNKQVTTDSYAAPASPVENVLRFFNELAEHWVCDTTVGGAQYEPDEYVDRLWVFKRR